MTDLSILIFGLTIKELLCKYPKISISIRVFLIDNDVKTRAVVSSKLPW